MYGNRVKINIHSFIHARVFKIIIIKNNSQCDACTRIGCMHGIEKCRLH